MPGISFIIPTLNAKEFLPECLRSLRGGSSEVEIIVSDGGSTDKTCEIAAEFGAHVVRSGRGRGLQCNEGAKSATGDILAFIHADSLLSENFFEVVASAFKDEEIQLAKFMLQFDLDHWLLNLSSRMARLDSFWTSFGDQGVIIRRSFFDELGAFKGWPLFEDVDLFARARKSTVIRLLPARIVTSAHKFKRHGVVKQQLKNGWLMLQYMFGISPRRLYEKYYS